MRVRAETAQIRSKNNKQLPVRIVRLTKLVGCILRVFIFFSMPLQLSFFVIFFQAVGQSHRSYLRLAVVL